MKVNVRAAYLHRCPFTIFQFPPVHCSLDAKTHFSPNSGGILRGLSITQRSKILPFFCWSSYRMWIQNQTARLDCFSKSVSRYEVESTVSSSLFLGHHILIPRRTRKRVIVFSILSTIFAVFCKWKAIWWNSSFSSLFYVYTHKQNISFLAKSRILVAC